MSQARLLFQFSYVIYCLFLCVVSCIVVFCVNCYYHFLPVVCCLFLDLQFVRIYLLRRGRVSGARCFFLFILCSFYFVCFFHLLLYFFVYYLFFLFTISYYSFFFSRSGARRRRAARRPAEQNRI